MITARKNGLLALVLVAVLAPLASAFAASQANKIVQGCTMGGRNDVYDQDYPRQALGSVPNRIANWEIGFQRGKYAVRIASRYEFIPLIYKHVGGKYRWAGLSRKVRFQNDRSGNAFFYYDFTANHLTGALNNLWLLQIKPVPEAQRVPHRVRVIVKVVSCPKEKPYVPQPCPPGFMPNPDTSAGIFGTRDRCVPIRR
jgi:hypothetical protein